MFRHSRDKTFENSEHIINIYLKSRIFHETFVIATKFNKTIVIELQ